MTRRGVRVGRALRVLGLVAVIVAVWKGDGWAVLAVVGAATTVVGLTLTAVLQFWFPKGGAGRPSDFAHSLDLLRRAVGARAGWGTGLADGPIEVPEEGDATLPSDTWERGAAFVDLAAGDGSTHVSAEQYGTFVAVGDGGYGAGVLLAAGDSGPVVGELRRLVAGMRLAGLEGAGGHGAELARQLATVAAGAASMEAVARAGAQLAHDVTQHGAAIVLRHGTSPPQVVAVAGADPRLEGLLLRDDAPAARAIDGGVPVVAARGEDVFGAGTPERRRREREGIALPLRDGHFVVGALVLVGRHVDTTSEQLGRLVAELGPRLASSRALQDAERRATRDPLTGLPNRAVLEQRVRAVTRNGSSDKSTMVYVDLDHFKQLNDTLGHAAGDAALRHVATIFASHIRGRDLVARMGGEEFAVWLPGTPLEEGVAVAERIRRSVETVGWTWSGTVWPLTVSCGVAAIPEHGQDVQNLLMLADKALYHAKATGRNRVEKASLGR